MSDMGMTLEDLEAENRTLREIIEALKNPKEVPPERAACRSTVDLICLGDRVEKFVVKQRSFVEEVLTIIESHQQFLNDWAGIVQGAVGDEHRRFESALEAFRLVFELVGDKVPEELRFGIVAQLNSWSDYR